MTPPLNPRIYFRLTQGTVPCVASEILEILPLSEFSKLRCELETNSHIDFDETKSVRLTDEEAKRIIEKTSGCKTVEEYQELPQKKSDRIYI